MTNGESLHDKELCPATGQKCSFITEAEKLYLDNSAFVEPDVAADDNVKYAQVVMRHHKLLEEHGDETGPTTNGRCPLHEAPGKSAVGHLIGGLYHSRNPI